MADNLKSQLFSGVFYTALAKYSGVVISLVVAGVLARLLSPDDFGIVAIATVIIAFFNLFTDMGVSPAIVQHKTLTREELSDIFSFTVWTGIGISALFFAASWLIAGYYNSDILRTLCQLLSVNLFFASATIVPGALFYRNKEFKFIAVRSFVIQISAGAAAVTAALCGAGLYALIINPIVSSILIFAISYQRYPQRLRLTLGLTVLRKIFSYSAYQFLFNVINYFSRNLDKLLIGKYMGMSDLGYYEKSYRLMMLPLQNITQVITPVMHPIFSDFQDDKGKLATSYERILRFLAFIGLPLSVFHGGGSDADHLRRPMAPVRTRFPDSVTVRRDSDHTVFFRLHLPGGGRHEEPVRVRTVLVRAQRGGHAARNLLFRHADGSGKLHRCHVHRQLRAMLLADVPGDFPAKRPAVRPSAPFSDGGKPADGGHSPADTVRDGRNKYFSYNNCKKYSKFYYLWGIYTSYA